MIIRTRTIGTITVLAPTIMEANPEKTTETIMEGTLEVPYHLLKYPRMSM